MSDRCTSQRVELLLAIGDDLNLLAADNLIALQADQHVGHTHVGEHLVVGAQRTARICVEGAQVGVQPVVATHTSDQSQIRRRRTEPGLGVVRLHADLHVVTDLGVAKHQIVEHDFVRDAEIIGNTLVTLVLGGMAAHAVVGERTRAVLQSSLVT